MAFLRLWLVLPSSGVVVLPCLRLDIIEKVSAYTLGSERGCRWLAGVSATGGESWAGIADLAAPTKGRKKPPFATSAKTDLFDPVS